MKPASPAPGWACLYPGLAENARSAGYTLACHGTLGRDFDLVAIPWTDQAKSVEELLEAIVDGFNLAVRGPEPKPHGRVAYSLVSKWTGPHSIDLSIMPRVAPTKTQKRPRPKKPAEPKSDEPEVECGERRSTS